MQHLFQYRRRRAQRVINYDGEASHSLADDDTVAPGDHYDATEFFSHADISAVRQSIDVFMDSIADNPLTALRLSLKECPETADLFGSVLQMLATRKASRLENTRLKLQLASLEKCRKIAQTLAALFIPQQKLTLVMHSAVFHKNVGIYLSEKLSLHVSRFIPSEEPPLVLFNKLERSRWLDPTVPLPFCGRDNTPLRPLSPQVSMTAAEKEAAPRKDGSGLAPARLLHLAALALANNWRNYDHDARITILRAVSLGHPLFTREHPIVATSLAKQERMSAMTLKRALEEPLPSDRDEKRARVDEKA